MYDDLIVLIQRMVQPSISLHYIPVQLYDRRAECIYYESKTLIAFDFASKKFCIVDECQLMNRNLFQMLGTVWRVLTH